MVAPIPTAASQQPTQQVVVDSLGGYQFGHHIGQSGDVYEAEHPRFQGRLALKMFRRSAGVGTAVVDAFSREAGRVSILRHPHIAQVMEAGALRDGTPFVSMELLSGQTLDEMLAGRGALLASDLLPLVRGIASALTAAHAAGIVHRELRPDNVFVVSLAGYEQGFVKVLDFGVSRLTAAERVLGRGAGVRAPSYMAPEQVAGRIEEITEAADQFALGALAYRLLSGSDPFVAHARPRGLERVGDAKAGPVAPLARRAPAVDAVVSKAMSRHPGDRFDSVALFFRAFEEALAGSALISTPMPVSSAREAPAPQLQPGAQATPPPGETPAPLVAPVDREPSRRTLFGPGPQGTPQHARDVPTREVPIATLASEVTPPPDTEGPVTPPPVVAAPRPALGMESARPIPTESPYPPQRVRNGPTSDDVTISQQFFYEGERQETERIVQSVRDRAGHDFADIHDYDSYERVPKRRAPLVLAMLVLLAGGAGAAWYMGWRPPTAWQQSEVWKTLRLPEIPPVGSPTPAAAPAAEATAAPTPTVGTPAVAAEPAAVAAPVDASAAPAPAAEAAPAPTEKVAEAAPPEAAVPEKKPEPEKSTEPDRSSRKRAASHSDRRSSALHGFVWSPAERAFVPSQPESKASAAPEPPPSADEPLPFPR